MWKPKFLRRMTEIAIAAFNHARVACRTAKAVTVSNEDPEQDFKHMTIDRLYEAKESLEMSLLPENMRAGSALSREDFIRYAIEDIASSYQYLAKLTGKRSISDDERCVQSNAHERVAMWSKDNGTNS